VTTFRRHFWRLYGRVLVDVGLTVGELDRLVRVAVCDGDFVTEGDVVGLRERVDETDGDCVCEGDLDCVCVTDVVGLRVPLTLGDRVTVPVLLTDRVRDGDVVADHV
jgi:hypothetical protein